MKTFTEPLKELKEFETLSAGVHDLRGIAPVSYTHLVRDPRSMEKYIVLSSVQVLRSVREA